MASHRHDATGNFSEYNLKLQLRPQRRWRNIHRDINELHGITAVYYTIPEVDMSSWSEMGITSFVVFPIIHLPSWTHYLTIKVVNNTAFDMGSHPYTQTPFPRRIFGSIVLAVLLRFWIVIIYSSTV